MMSQFAFANELKNCVRMDEPITKGPIPRWQKKCLEASNSSNTSLNISKKTSASFNGSLSRTPSKRNLSAENAGTKKTPSKTPKKSPGSSTNSTTPSSAKGSKTPNGGDRFIPNRNTTNFDLGHYKVNQDQQPDDEMTSPSQKEMQRIMAENLHGGDVQNMRILAFKNKAPGAPDGYINPLKVVYSHSKTPASVKCSSRYIPQTPDRILDAPDIMDDYYLNLIDWSPNNVLGVALGSNVYLWNGSSGSIQQLLTLEGSDYVCSLGWIQEGHYLAVGTSMGVIQLWDCASMKRIRIMGGHSARVGSLAWNSYILSSGSRSGQIIHHDVRQRDHVISELSIHTQEVCGLKWSPDGRYLASGGNDNMLYIWPIAQGQVYSQPQPLYSLSAHQAAVKALAWCPWQPSILASGGGTADRCIRFWNCNTGTCFNTIDTKSQVCALQWSTIYKEFISGHGYANNQLVIWKYPSMTKVAELTGHTARVLHLAMSPDGSTVLSAGADETLRLWKCFAPDPAKKKKETTETKAVSTIFKGIR
ncbi:cell division cycle protein 20 homolog isoform X2 [Periplaneta americana]|uniref:cell division cycle protein 20 homolog isoform X2 n=1 Tax=Periplaneta americana TaxID=6978 RepID=UPI0037E91CC1